MEEQNKPVDTIRLGTLKAAIWQNETESGPRYAATFLIDEGFRLIEQARAEERQRAADVLLETARKYRRVDLNGDAE